MRKATTGMLEQGTQTPSPAPDLIPAETSTENLHWDWYTKRGHFRRLMIACGPQKVCPRWQDVGNAEFSFLWFLLTHCHNPGASWVRLP